MRYHDRIDQKGQQRPHMRRAPRPQGDPTPGNTAAPRHRASTQAADGTPRPGAHRAPVAHGTAPRSARAAQTGRTTHPGSAAQTGSASHAAGRRTAAVPRRAPRPRKRRSLAPFAIGIAALVAIVLVGWGAVTALGSLFGGAPAATHDDNLATIEETATDPGDIVIGLNGDADTKVLVGEDYLESGAHAAEPTDGILTPKIKTSGSVDTSKPGKYEVTYTVSDSAGHTATTTRTVHVVEEMDAQTGDIPVLMYHYVYTADAPPENLNGNYILNTDLEAQLAYLTENDYYFPSFPEVRAFLEGTHTLPANSIVLTFDDGELGFLTCGVEMLEKYQVPATSFIIASQEDATAKMVEHASPYVSYESHSFNMHRAGGTVGHGGVVSALSRDEIVADLKQAEELVGSSQAFAYPYGDTTADALAAVDEAGILCAFTTENRRCEVGDDVRALPRVRISGDYSLDGFKSLVS